MWIREIMSSVENHYSEPESKKQKIEFEINVSSSLLLSSCICNYLYGVYGMCIDCTLVEIEEGLEIPNEEALTNSLETIENKLHLVLDLDHTLLHSRKISLLSKAEKYLIDEADSVTRNDLWRIESVEDSISYLTKLRPFLADFLEEANELFIMHVYTKSTRKYANLILEVIDPNKLYFGDRVITRDESPGTKTLDLVMANPSKVVIVDDRPKVWPENKLNVVEISQYNYFKIKGQKSESYSEEKTDESETDGALAKVLKLLVEIHTRFFKAKEDVLSKDVRLLIQQIKLQSRKELIERYILSR